MFVGTYGQSVSNLFAGNFPTAQVGIQISMPLRNRTAEAQSAISAAEGRRLQAIRDQIGMAIEADVRNSLQARDLGAIAAGGCGSGAAIGGGTVRERAAAVSGGDVYGVPGPATAERADCGAEPGGAGEGGCGGGNRESGPGDGKDARGAGDRGEVAFRPQTNGENSLMCGSVQEPDSGVDQHAPYPLVAIPDQREERSRSRGKGRSPTLQDFVFCETPFARTCGHRALERISPCNFPNTRISAICATKPGSRPYRRGPYPGRRPIAPAGQARAQSESAEP